ncbi:MAG: winged helix-turn-helix transcriptional regulator [Proteobacteria bacterium]|uniref:MarR family winged helix-turn-helix transcriptional regulator n=1 Tax=Aquabacterium sp. TaxID=1872578 RepID=UPI0035C77D31|nr:winged helix-turn-helix transcriptional regulator [Pseudomonadota bacterium]
MSSRRPSPAPEHLHLDAQLCFALYASSLAMTKLYKPLLAPLGLTYPQYLVMLVLWEADDRTVHELGELLQLDSGTLTPLLKRMEAAGQVSRHRDPADERRVRIRLTPQGRALRRQAQGVPSQVLCQAGIDGSELAALRAQLHALRERLQPHNT